MPAGLAGPRTELDERDPHSTRRPEGRSRVSAGAALWLGAEPARGDGGGGAAGRLLPLRLNTALLRGYGLGIVEQVDLAGAAGYDGIEPWIADVQKYAGAGGSLPDLKRRISDRGPVVESAIGFAPWIVEGAGSGRRDSSRRGARWSSFAQIGGKRIAAPPAGAVEGPAIPLSAVSERYRALLEAGATTGVAAQLEVWGFANNVSRMSEAAYAAIEAGHPDAPASSSTSTTSTRAAPATRASAN